MFTGAYYAGYLKGWYANSDKVNSEHKVKNKKSEKAVATVEQKTAAASTEGKVIYRDVVNYFNDPNHIKCDFDDHAVQLRQQQAIDAANNTQDFMNPPCKAGDAGRDSAKTCRQIPLQWNLRASCGQTSIAGRRGTGQRNSEFLFATHSED